jgi:uracil-DNA glycosylase family 4
VDSLAAIAAEVSACRRCPRLVAWREQVAAEKRASFAAQTYWGRGVSGFGDGEAGIVVVGLAPAAHGANRTGRMFTGDRSGDWLFGVMHEVGLASQPTSSSADDGLRLIDAYVTSTVKCAPPANAPTPDERRSCAPYLAAELALLGAARGAIVVVCLGALAFTAVLDHFGVRPRPRFGHGVEVALDEGPVLIASYHPSQQNTFTGRLTWDMLRDVFDRAVVVAGRRWTSDGRSEDDVAVGPDDLEAGGVDAPHR